MTLYVSGISLEVGVHTKESREHFWPEIIIQLSLGVEEGLNYGAEVCSRNCNALGRCNWCFLLASATLLEFKVPRAGKNDGRANFTTLRAEKTMGGHFW